MNATALTSHDVAELVHKIRITPGREADFEDAVRKRDWLRAVDCCRNHRVEDVVDGVMGKNDLLGGIGYIPRYEFFAEVTDYLSDDEYFPLLGVIWIEVEKRITPTEAEILFRPGNCDPAKRRLVMLPQEQVVYDHLPDSFVVYRGCTRDTIENCSWTRSQSVAMNFAQHPAAIVDPLSTEDQTPIVLQGVTSKAYIFAVFTRWKEEEIAVSPDRVISQQEIWHG